MRVFLTGASGFVGSAIIKELLSNGHTVLGLARSDKSAETLSIAGVDVHRGSLEDLESLKTGAAACDGVIHCGFSSDFSDYSGVCETDRHAIEAMGSVLIGSNKPIVLTTGSFVLKPGEIGTEDSGVDPSSMSAARISSEIMVPLLAEKGVRISVIRLPPSVHGDDDHAFVPAIIAAARAKGVVIYVGDGQNRWPAVHRSDAARLYRLALEKGVAGSRYHCVAEEGIPIKEIVDVVGKHLNLPTESQTPEDAFKNLGFLAVPLGIDNPCSSKRTRKLLGWQPTQVGLIQDLDQGTYFTSGNGTTVKGFVNL